MDRVIIVAVIEDNKDESLQHASVEELKSLVKTAHGTVVETSLQNRRTADVTSYVGKGKVYELQEKAEEFDADLIVVNGELSPRQGQSLSESTGVAVIDRTQLILDIFAERARTREGRIQVELAQLTYLLPRLRGQGLSLSRLGGGIGTRGPGETKLETDRRHIRGRMDELKKDLARIQKHREVIRKQKDKSEFPYVTLVGYTNAGKTTLLNVLTDEEAFAEDLLFATLDPLTRNLRLPSGMHVQLSDTVGFIRDLPTTLIAAFRSTLQEVADADLLLHVIDGTSVNKDAEKKTVDKLLDELGASGVPAITVVNKADRNLHEHDHYVPMHTPSIHISAAKKENVDELLLLIENELKKMMHPFSITLPAGEGKTLTRIRNTTIVDKLDFNKEDETYTIEGHAFLTNRDVERER